MSYPERSGQRRVDLGSTRGGGPAQLADVLERVLDKGIVIAGDIQKKLAEAGFPNPKVQIVMEPAWSPQRISEAGRKALGI